MNKYTEWEICRCGKRPYPTKEKAEEFIRTPAAGRRHIIRAYECEYGGVWHVTKRVKFYDTELSKTDLLELELKREMATIKQFVIDYMDKAYKERNVVEFSSSEVKEAYIKAYPGKTGESIYGTIGFLKKDGIIVDLEKHVPGSSKGTFFTLARILEKETNPVSKKTVAIPNQPESKPTPISVAPNPFDKVNSQLDQLLTIVKGLAQGYSEIAKRSPDMGQALLDVSKAIVEEQRQHRDQIIEKLDKEAKYNSTGYVEIMSAIQNRSAAPVEIKADIIADAVNLRLTDLTKEDALIYRIREEVSTITDAESKWIVENIQVPEGVSNQNDYREGIREGIRLASEMNLVIRKVQD